MSISISTPWLIRIRREKPYCSFTATRICIIQPWMEKKKDDVKMTHWHDLFYQTISVILIRLAVIFLANDLCCLRWELITRDINLGLITLPLVDIHVTASSVLLMSLHSLHLLLHQSKLGFPISTFFFLIKSAASDHITEWDSYLVLWKKKIWLL